MLDYPRISERLINVVGEKAKQSLHGGSKIIGVYPIVLLQA